MYRRKKIFKRIKRRSTHPIYGVIVCICIFVAMSVTQMSPILQLQSQKEVVLLVNPLEPVERIADAFDLYNHKRFLQ